MLSQGTGILSLETGELDLEREFGTFNRRPPDGLDAKSDFKLEIETKCMQILFDN